MKRIFAISALALCMVACGSSGSSSGESSEFEGDTFTDNRDGAVYKVVKIGSQVWMAENLNYNYTEKTRSGQRMSFCYEDSEKNCKKYGRLYMWSAAIDSVKLANDKKNPLYCGYMVDCEMPSFVQGICPDGWHLPKKEEWEMLLESVGGADSASAVLRSTKGWKNGKNGTDDFNFNVLPAGSRTNRDSAAFMNIGEKASFWTSSDDPKHGMVAFDAHINTVDAYVRIYNSTKDIGFSVRCVKD